MKISTTNTFDVSQIANTKSYQELQTFFEYINVFTTDVVQAFNKKITFNDNISFTSLPLTVKHGEAINIGKFNPISADIISETPYKNFALTTNADSTKNLTVYFQDVINVLARSAIWVAGTTIRYQIQNISNISLGDFVKTSGFGLAANNGTFQVVGKDTSNNYIYLNNYNRTSNTADETKTGYVGASATTYSITVGLVNA